AVVEHIVRAVPGHLREGGLCQVLGNWMVLRDQPWEERLTGWVEGCDAWVVQRETVDLPTYVELWLKDAGLHPSTGSGTTADYVRRYDTWLAWFEEQGAEGGAFGWIHPRRGPAGRARRVRAAPTGAGSQRAPPPAPSTASSTGPTTSLSRSVTRSPPTSAVRR